MGHSAINFKTMNFQNFNSLRMSRMLNYTTRVHKNGRSSVKIEKKDNLTICSTG